MAKEQTVISHWDQLIESFQASPLAFYESVEAAIKKREIPNTSISRIEFKEGGVLTARREYLRVVRGKHSFDICGAPFGTGFFFSWWFTELPSAHGLLYLLGILFGTLVFVAFFFRMGFLIGAFSTVFLVPLLFFAIGNSIREGHLGSEDVVLAIPIIGFLYERIFKPATYYKIDTGLMFQHAVHNAVMEVIDQMTVGKGVRALSESERKPILKAFAQSA